MASSQLSALEAELKAYGQSVQSADATGKDVGGGVSTPDIRGVNTHTSSSASNAPVPLTVERPLANPDGIRQKEPTIGTSAGAKEHANTANLQVDGYMLLLTPSSVVVDSTEGHVHLFLFL